MYSILYNNAVVINVYSLTAVKNRAKLPTHILHSLFEYLLHARNAAQGYPRC